MATYTMAQYSAAPQHKKKMKWTMMEKTIDFSAVPHATAALGGKATTWAANDILEVLGLRPGQIFMGITVEVIKPTSINPLDGHEIKITVAPESDDIVLATVKTNGDAFPYGISPYILADIVGSKDTMPQGLFCQPMEIPTSGTIDFQISAAFTEGIVKLVAYLLEEDRT